MASSKTFEDFLESYATGRKKEPVIEMSDPLYVATSDHPGMVIANKFGGIGFQTWKRTVLISLMTKNKAGIVDGSVTRSADDENKAKAWD